MFLPLKRPIGLALVAMLLLAVSPAVLAADDAPPENPRDVTIIHWIDGLYDLLVTMAKSVVGETWPHPKPDNPANGNPPDNGNTPQSPGTNGDNMPPEEIGPNVEPGPP